MPRTANSASRSNSAPVRSATTALTVVLSAPVGSGSGPGRSTSTNLVTAPGWSARAVASAGRRAVVGGRPPPPPPRRPPPPPPRRGRGPPPPPPPPGGGGVGRRGR